MNARNEKVTDVMSLFGKCVNYEFKNYSTGYWLFQLVSKDMIKGWEAKFTFTTKKILFHSPKIWPILTTEDTDYTHFKFLYQPSTFKFTVTRYEFQRLPKPYETQCQDYGNSSHYKCLNDCYYSEYTFVLQCIPNYKSLFTVKLVNDSTFNAIPFCSVDNKTAIDSINSGKN